MLLYLHVGSLEKRVWHFKFWAICEWLRSRLKLRSYRDPKTKKSNLKILSPCMLNISNPQRKFESRSLGHGSVRRRPAGGPRATCANRIQPGREIPRTERVQRGEKALRRRPPDHSKFSRLPRQNHQPWIRDWKRAGSDSAAWWTNNMSGTKTRNAMQGILSIEFRAVSTWNFQVQKRCQSILRSRPNSVRPKLWNHHVMKT